MLAAALSGNVEDDDLMPGHMLPGHRVVSLVVAGHFCVCYLILRVGDSSLMLLFGRCFIRQSEMMERSNKFERLNPSIMDMRTILPNTTK